MSEGANDQTAPPGVTTGRQRRLVSPIPLVDLTAQHRSLENALREALSRMLESSGFILGEDVEAFEREFAAFCGVKHAVGVGSGLEALTLTLKALDLKRTVLVDVDPERYNMDPDLTAAAVTRKTRAILPVHIYGQPAAMDELREIARLKKLILVEDACQAHGATLRDERCGSMSDAGCFSFYPSKNLGALGDGGMVVTDRDDLTEGLRVIRNYGQAGKNRHTVKGVNSRLDAFQAAVLRVKLRNLPKWNESRRRLAALYRQGLEGLPVVPPQEAEDVAHVYHLYVIRTESRDELMRHLEGLGVSCGIHYPVPIHLQKAFADLGMESGSFPVTERLSGEILSLPMYPEMAGSDIDRVCEAITGFFGTSSS
jgi:dTDP-4-amino-4,6-dideoxygalactose transaminase